MERFAPRSRTSVHLSAHAIKRFQERTPFQSPIMAQNFAQEALQQGRSIKDFIGACRVFLQEKTRGGYHPVVWRGLLLVFSPDQSTVVTVYRVPTWFRAAMLLPAPQPPVAPRPHWWRMWGRV